MKNLKYLSLTALMLLSFGIAVFAQNVTVAGSTGANASYPSLGSAFTALNGAGTQAGNNITVTITADTTETASAVLNQGDWTTLTISPSGTRIVSGAIAGHLIDLNGADNVTIDGLFSPNALTITNTDTGTGSSTIRFINDATNNTVTNSTVLGATGSALSSGFGVIYFATGTTTGNDNNTISNNNISAAAGGNPINGIYSAGTSAAIDNSGITISNNNISDFFNANGINTGINVNSGSSTWTITDNKLFQTATRTFLTANTHSGILVLTGNGYNIDFNKIGFASSSSTGTYAMAGTVATRFIGINLTAGTGATSSVQGNSIREFTLATSSGAATANGIFCGINITGSGNVDVGTTSTNVIGAVLGVNSIVATSTTTGGLVVGINSSTVGVVNIRQNFIGGLSSSGTTAAVAGSVNGINISGVATGLTISNNTIGNPTADNMRGGTSGLTTGSSLVAGIAFNSSPSATVNVTGNIIQNLSSFGSGTGSYSRGMFTATTTSTATTYLITGNTIHDLKSNGALTGASSGNTTVVGIHQLAGVGSDISRNTIYNLAALNTGTGGYVVTGISLAGSTVTTALNTTCTRNSISNLSNAGTGTTATAPPVIAGVTIRSGNNLTVVVNNMINLGSGITTNTSIIGIWGNHGSTPNPIDNIYHNSINITGTAAAGALPSFGFLRGDFATAAKTPIVDIRNNIFSNTRSGGTGKHYAIAENFGATAPSTTGWGANASNYNVLFANAATVGYWGADQTFGTWQTASASDANSISSDPLYLSATDAHLTAGSPARNIAFNLGSVGNDFDGDVRPGTNALFDIGADEFDGYAPVPNDMRASAFINPINGGTRGSGIPFAVQASFSNIGTSTQTNVTVRYRIIDAGLTEVYNQTAVIPSLAPNATTAVSFPNATLPANGTYTIKAKSELAGDTVTANDEITGTITALSPLTGTYTVGTGGSYTSLTNAGGIFEALNTVGASSPIVINITSDLTGETGAISLNEVQGNQPITIKPSGGPRSITGNTPTGTALIKINGADNVTINGSTSAPLVGGDAALRELTLTNSGAGAIIWIATNATSGATNNVIKNTNLVGGGSAVGTQGIIAGSGATFGGGAENGRPNSNNTIQNNSAKGVQNAIFALGDATTLDQNWTITENNFGSTVVAEKLFFRGIALQNAQNFNISQNIISGINSTTTTSATMSGILVGATLNGGTISRNQIKDIRQNNTSGFGANGIFLNASSTASNVTIANNFISDIIGVGFNGVTQADNGYGIMVNTGGGYKIYYNSVSMSTNQTAVGSITAAINIAAAVTTAGSLDIRNNIFANTETVGTVYGILNSSTAGNAIFSTINYNDYFATNVGFQGVAQPTLADWQAATGQDANSQKGNPNFIDPVNDLHQNPLNIYSSVTYDKGTPVSVTDDFDGQIRSTIGRPGDPTRNAGGVPDIGADELLAPVAAGATLTGKLVTPSGRGLANSQVMLTDSTTGEVRYTRSGSFGVFTFEDLPTGHFYILDVPSKKYRFNQTSFTLNGDLTDLVLTAQ